MDNLDAATKAFGDTLTPIMLDLADQLDAWARSLEAGFVSSVRADLRDTAKRRN